MTVSVDTALLSGKRKGKLFHHVSHLEEGDSRPEGAAQHVREVEHALCERLKELNCLYGISRLVESHGNSLQSILQGIVDLLPPSWQYPEICCARLVLYDQQYETVDFRQTAWRQSAEIGVDGQPAGFVEIYYFEEMVEHDEGAFLKEERDLIDVIVERVGHLVEHVQVEQHLKVERAALRERVKELSCLYGISDLVERHRDALGPILQGIVDLLPQSWQYPDICSAGLILNDKRYTTANFQETEWKQSADIHVNGTLSGVVEVRYAKKMPDADEGPFLIEERKLINAIAERTGRIIGRIQTEHQLEVERKAVEESNVGLRKVLAQIEEDKKEMYDSITANVDKVLMPVLRALEGEIPDQQKKYVALLQKHLDGFTSPFTNRLSKAFAVLSPIEIEICNMIQNGMTTKDIAQVRHVSPRTIAKQRERIRKKLQLTGTDANLATRLRMFASDQPQ